MAALEEQELQEARRRADRAVIVRTAIFIVVGILNLGFLGWAFRLVTREMFRREMATEEISRQKELLSTTLASIGDAVIVTDAQGTVTFLNAEAERLTGWKTPEASGKPLSQVFRIVHESTRQPVENPIDKVLRLGRVVGLDNHTVLIDKSGLERPIDDGAAPIRTPQGPVFGVVLVFRDFSEHKQADALAQALNGINQELLTSLQFDQVMQRALSAAAAALGSDTAAVSLRRDGRWTVAHVHGFPREVIGAQMNDDEERHAVLAITSQKPVAVDDAFNDSRVSTEHMRKSYSKVVRADMALKPVDLDRLTRDIVGQYPHLKAHQAEIEVAGPLLPVIGNLALLTQSISNFLGNAVKFVKPGVKPKVRIWTETHDSRVRFCVRDNGIGVAAGQLERIWRIFERAHNQEQYPGTGIGLSIVKRSVERMGGAVGVLSEPGQGSNFWLELTKA